MAHPPSHYGGNPAMSVSDVKAEPHKLSAIVDSELTIIESADHSRNRWMTGWHEISGNRRHGSQSGGRLGGFLDGLKPDIFRLNGSGETITDPDDQAFWSLWPTRLQQSLQQAQQQQQLQSRSSNINTKTNPRYNKYLVDHKFYSSSLLHHPLSTTDAVSALPTPAATTPVKPFAVRPSPTDDMGAFATRALLPNEVILDGKRFPYN
ncbi:hypothetical protein MY10362_009534 [Beauveria mimosiformis]